MGKNDVQMKSLIHLLVITLNFWNNFDFFIKIQFIFHKRGQIFNTHDYYFLQFTSAQKEFNL